MLDIGKPSGSVEPLYTGTKERQNQALKGEGLRVTRRDSRLLVHAEVAVLAGSEALSGQSRTQR